MSGNSLTGFIRTFLPGQFRDYFLGAIGPFQVTATIASTAAGANGSAQASAAAGAGNAQALANCQQATDFILEVIPTVAQTAGVAFTGTITANGVVWITASNGTGGAY